MGDYIQPTELEDVFSALREKDWKILAGGTDYYPSIVGQYPDDNLLDITRVTALSGVRDKGDSYRIGSATTWTELVKTELPAMFDGLKQAAKEVGGRQIQNSGTIGGNICNASPAADGTAALLSLNAEIELLSRAGTRRLPLIEFVLGNRRTDLHAGEIVTGIVVPKTQSPKCLSQFLKLGSRKYLVISLVMVSGVIGIDEGGRVEDCRIAVGACSEVASRLTALEKRLEGLALSEVKAGLMVEGDFDHLSPIDDVRASAEYRLQSARILVGRLLDSWGNARV